MYQYQITIRGPIISFGHQLSTAALFSSFFFPFSFLGYRGSILLTLRFSGNFLSPVSTGTRMSEQRNKAVHSWKRVARRRGSKAAGGNNVPASADAMRPYNQGTQVLSRRANRSCMENRPMLFDSEDK